MTTAFVFSGGGSLGAVQVGMLLALAERGVRPDVVVGASVGALNAAYLAGDPSPDAAVRLAAVWRGVRRPDVFPLPGPAALPALTGRRNHLLSNLPLRRLVQRHVPYRRLEDAVLPVAVVATEVLTGLEVAIARGPVVDAVLASTALPGVFPPVEVEGHLLMDGGVVDNTPLSVAVELGADRVFVLPTGYACALPAPPRSALAMALHAFTVAHQQRLIADVAELQHRVELTVLPPLCPLAVSPVDFTRTDELVTRARADSGRWLDAPCPPEQTGHLSLHRHDGRSPQPDLEAAHDLHR